MKWSIITFSFLAVLVTTACALSYKYTHSETNNNVKSYVKDSKFPNIEIESEVGEYDDYKYAIHFPQTDNTDINDIVKTFISEQRDIFLDNAKDLNGNNENYSELLLDYEITYLSKDIISILFRNSTYLVGGSREEHLYALNFDRQSGKKLEITSLIADKQATKKLEIMTKRILLQNPNITCATDGFEEDLNKYSIFYFADSTLNISFTNDLVQQENEKPYIVEIPYHKLSGIIQESYLTSLVQTSNTETSLLSEEISSKVTEENTPTLLPGEKYVALTFDDGPHSERTPHILDILKKYDVLATFFVLGNRAEYYPEIVQRAYNEGHEIGNHTWSHPKLTALSQEQLLQQLNKTSNLIASITGEAPATLRPPYGAFNDTVKRVANMPIINWSVDTLDWKHKNKQKMLEIVRNTTTNGSIILMHDIHQVTADSLEDIIIELSNQGYKFVTVSTLLQLENSKENIAGQVYLSAS